MFLTLDGSVSTENRCGEALGNKAPRQCPLSAMSSELVSAALPGYLGKGEKQRDIENSGCSWKEPQHQKAQRTGEAIVDCGTVPVTPLKEFKTQQARNIDC